MEKNNKTIILTGGGTMGSVTPLLVLGKELQKLGYLIVFIGTKGGVEKESVEKAGFYFLEITSAKFHRYITPKLLIQPFKLLKAYFEAKKIIKKFKPKLVLGSGGFVQVPVMRAAKSELIPYGVHQQDLRPSLANTLVAKKASFITTTFEKSKQDYQNENIVWTGNPVSKEVIAAQENYAKFGFKHDKPVLFVTGGGTGAVAINKLVFESIRELTKTFQVIHQTGAGKNLFDFKDPNYFQTEFLDHPSMFEAFKIASIVVSRAGLSTLSELSRMQKVAVFIPMPNTHQEENTEFLKSKQAAVILDQNILTPEIFSKEIIDLYKNKEQQKKLTTNFGNLSKIDATNNIIKVMKKWL